MNKISELDGAIFEKMRNIQLLNASRNYIIKISPSIAGCSRLEKIIVDDNMLRDIPEEIGQIKGLRVLSLHNN